MTYIFTNVCVEKSKFAQSIKLIREAHFSCEENTSSCPHMNSDAHAMLDKLCIVPLSEESLGGGKRVGVREEKKPLQMNMDIPEWEYREDKWG